MKGREMMGMRRKWRGEKEKRCDEMNVMEYGSGEDERQLWRMVSISSVFIKLMNLERLINVQTKYI
jgi:hypothetical protein